MVSLLEEKYTQLSKQLATLKGELIGPPATPGPFNSVREALEHAKLRSQQIEQAQKEIEDLYNEELPALKELTDLCAKHNIKNVQTRGVPTNG
tara:strand:+ start:294 stop:572 length:279 start_codon:yes stop_codon:yes gene_type:complete